MSTITMSHFKLSVIPLRDDGEEEFLAAEAISSGTEDCRAL
ncbi:MAG: hypothetical protein QGM50_05130 [Anaerolineae bacterium]|nr:hypothetical protein [Anaerolineae bacterium]MDK1118159.1 hypothetical protein [Anaerolineae bacterium]